MLVYAKKVFPISAHLGSTPCKRMIDELYAVLEADVLAADLAILTSFTILYSLLVEGVCQALSPFPSIKGTTI